MAVLAAVFLQDPVESHLCETDVCIAAGGLAGLQLAPFAKKPNPVKLQTVRASKQFVCGLLGKVTTRTDAITGME